MINGTYACCLQDMKISREIAEVIAAKFVWLGIAGDLSTLSELVVHRRRYTLSVL